MMNLNTVLNSSRKMMFENDVKGYEYSACGTVFLCRFHRGLYAVTAGHVVSGFDPSSARVMAHQEDDEFLPHNGLATFFAGDEEDTDYADLAVMPIDSTMVDSRRFRDRPPFELHDFPFPRELLPEGRLILRGFPDDQKSGIDFEECRIRVREVTLKGKWVGHAPMKYCHEIKFQDVSSCTTLDGLSGSPVFWVGEVDRRASFMFVGVLIRATCTSKTGYFVDAEVLRKAVRQIVSGGRQGRRGD